MLPLSGDLLQVLATFSAIGFAITFAIPTLIAAWEDIAEKTRSHEVITKQQIRLVAVFTRPIFIMSFQSLSLIFITSGCLCLLYYLSSFALLVEVAVWLQLISMFGTIFLIILILMNTSVVGLKEIKRLLDTHETWVSPQTSNQN